MAKFTPTPAFNIKIKNFRDIPVSQSSDIYQENSNPVAVQSVFRLVDRILGAPKLQTWSEARERLGKSSSMALGLADVSGVLGSLESNYGKGLALEIQVLADCSSWDEFNRELGRRVRQWRDTRQTKLLLHVQHWIEQEDHIHGEVRETLQSALAELGVLESLSPRRSEMIESGFRNFLPNVFQGGLIAGMLLGGPLGSASRSQVLSALWRVPASRVSRGDGAHLLSGGVGLFVESFGVVLGSRIYRGSWGFSHWVEEYRGMVCSLGWMKLGGVYFENFRLSGLGRFFGYSWGHRSGQTDFRRGGSSGLDWWLQRGIEFFQLELGGKLAAQIAPGIQSWQESLQKNLAIQSHAAIGKELFASEISLPWPRGLALAGISISSNTQELNIFSEVKKTTSSSKNNPISLSESQRDKLPILRDVILQIPVQERTLAKVQSVIRGSHLDSETIQRLIGQIKLRPMPYFMEDLGLTLVRGYVYRDDAEREAFLNFRGQGWLKDFSEVRTFLGKNAIRLVVGEMISEEVMSLGETATRIGVGKSSLSTVLLTPSLRKAEFIKMVSLAILALPINQGGHGIRIRILSHLLGISYNSILHWVNMFRLEWPEVSQWKKGLSPWEVEYQSKISEIKNKIFAGRLAAIEEVRSLQSQGAKNALQIVSAKYNVSPNVLEFWISSYE